MSEKTRSTVILRDDMIFAGYNNGYTVPLDAKKGFGGHDAGISPMSLMLTSLGGCTAMDVISILRKKKQDVTAFEVQVDGVRAEEHPKVWTEIWVKFTVTGHQIDQKAVDRAIELSRDKYCGAAATLRLTATIHYSNEIIEADEAESE